MHPSRRPRFGAVDVHYPPAGGAWAALVVAEEPRFADLVAEHLTWVDDVAPYEPGNFWQREFPVLRALLTSTDPVELLIVDGYVDLDPQGRPGLGARVHQAFGMPVIGVAKTAFRSATHAAAITRGTATRPLFVTAAGLPLDDAARWVQRMAGPHRLPDALRRVDLLGRAAGPGPSADGVASLKD